jgi:hypothetical protein
MMFASLQTPIAYDKLDKAAMECAGLANICPAMQGVTSSTRPERLLP